MAMATCPGHAHGHDHEPCPALTRLFVALAVAGEPFMLDGGGPSMLFEQSRIARLVLGVLKE